MHEHKPNVAPHAKPLLAGVTQETELLVTTSDSKLSTLAKSFQLLLGVQRKKPICPLASFLRISVHIVESFLRDFPKTFPRQMI